MKPFRYSIVVEWSDEDAMFVARVPALAGCAAQVRRDVLRRRDFFDPRLLGAWIGFTVERREELDGERKRRSRRNRDGAAAPRRSSAF